MRRGTLATAVVAAAIALPGLRNGFVYDDVQAIVANPLVHSLANSAHIWVSSYWPAGLLYRPLTIQLFTLEWWLGGGTPWCFHLVNLLLYAAVAVLVYRIAVRWVGEPGALFVGALFAVHPIHVEVVANAVGQSELLAALGILLATDRYLAWRSSGGLGPGRRAALAGLYLMAIAAKETGYVLPVWLAAIELFEPDPRPWRERARALGPVFGLLAAVAAAGLLVRSILFLGLKGESAQRPLRGYGPWGRAVLMLAVLPQWFRLLVWPVHLQAHYGPPELPTSTRLTTAHVLGLLLLLLTVAVLLLSRRRAPVVALSLGWIGVGLLPVSNLFAATGILLAERTLFLPSVGLALLAGWGIQQVKRSASRKAYLSFAAAGVVLLALGGARSVLRAEAWRSQSEFFAALERDAPGSYRAQLTAGVYYLGERRFADAERVLHSAWTLYQNDPTVYETYGQLFRVQHRCDRALPIFSEGLSRHPGATTLRARLVECSLALGDTARARALATEAVRLGQPEFEATLRRLAPRP